MSRRKLLCYGHFCYPKRIKHDRSRLVKYHNKNYCLCCLRYYKAVKCYRTRLYHFIEDVSHVTFPTGMMLRNIKKLREYRHYTYKGILNSLLYIRAIRRNFDWNSDYFINYVPYVYERAKKWRYNQAEHKYRIQNGVYDKNLGDLDDNTIVKTVTYTRVFHRKPKSRPFNMNRLDKEIKND